MVHLQTIPRQRPGKWNREKLMEVYVEFQGLIPFIHPPTPPAYIPHPFRVWESHMDWPLCRNCILGVLCSHWGDVQYFDMRTVTCALVFLFNDNASTRHHMQQWNPWWVEGLDSTFDEVKNERIRGGHATTQWLFSIIRVREITRKLSIYFLYFPHSMQSLFNHLSSVALLKNCPEFSHET